MKMKWIIRSIVAVNFVRFLLAFVPSFEGTEKSVGAADKIFAWRISGFRADFVWLVITTVLIFIAGIYFLLGIKEDRTAKTDALLCAAWVLAFFIYIARSLFTGMIDFG